MVKNMEHQRDGKSLLGGMRAREVKAREGEQQRGERSRQKQK